tara:strand:- start:13519 stop:14697 length:1179 start_codon:yes stop_codon:yes gene_type:complete
METILPIIIILGLIAIYLKKPHNNNIKLNELLNKISELEKNNSSITETNKNLQNNLKITETKLTSLEEIKTEKIQLIERLKNIELERNNLKNENIKLQKEEESRNDHLRRSIDSTNILQDSLKTEIARVNDERVKEIEIKLEKMKSKWNDHEKEIQNYIKLICNNHLINYYGQEDFPHPRNKPDNSIEILDQLIVFDAKSPANDDLSNFPKYIKNQTENLQKYAKHDNVKKDLFLVIPSNTLHVIENFSYNIGDYNVYIITKDALEPIILSLKKIEEYEFADKLSPEDRDNICRLIGKFAHTTKRRIQIDQFFAEEFLDALQKAKKLPSDILENVIQFENAEKINPPMEKRKKQILTKDLREKSKQIKKEIEIRNIPEIDANIKFKSKEKND